MRGSRAALLMAVLAIVVGLAPRASGITIRADRSQGSYLTLGARPEYASVGRLDLTTAAGRYVGSATLIAPDWVLTAAHMVDGATALKFTLGSNAYTAEQWFAHPGWTGDLLAGYDIGLVKLSASVGGVTAAARYSGTKEFGLQGTVVGFGMTGTGLTGSTLWDGQKRAAQNVVDGYYGTSATSARLLLTDFDNPRAKSDSSFGSSQPLNLEGLVAPGDSGGGLFVRSGKDWVLAGVTSFVGAFDGKADSDYGDVGGFIRVSAFNSWIDEIMGSVTGTAFPALAGAGDGSARHAPEPASLVLIGLGGAGLLLRRRRRA